ncbi:hypothetical protein AcetOrient_orf00061 [Acetobacter orientalis]|uniref:Uncharacterized protein n=1 Tax=Acetobacter orientalis TaxID=146474 RepID=A0A2Z5ZDL3_9PROT|nr:hypothetical protein AcetOrient_orf00061 [Acetobacter orientalis]
MSVRSRGKNLSQTNIKSWRLLQRHLFGLQKLLCAALGK